MKKIKLSMITCTVVLFASCSGNSQNEMTASHQLDAKKVNSIPKNQGNKTVKSQTIKLQKGELFLIISSITKPNAQNLMNEYFEKIFPIASKYGFKPLANLPIDKVVAGNYAPNNFFGLYTWPSMEAVQSFLTELPQSELTPMRKKIWEELKQVIVSVDKDIEITLRDDKVYEIRIIWSNGSNQNNNAQSKLKKYAGKSIVNYQVTGYEDLNEGKKPTYVQIIEWTTTESAEKYRKKEKMVSEKEESFFTHLQIKE